MTQSLTYRCPEGAWTMARSTRRVRPLGFRIDGLLIRLGERHPYLAFWTALVVMPLGLIAALGISTTAIMLPIAWLCGWL